MTLSLSCGFRFPSNFLFFSGSMLFSPDRLASGAGAFPHATPPKRAIFLQPLAFAAFALARCTGRSQEKILPRFELTFAGVSRPLGLAPFCNLVFCLFWLS